MKICIGLLLIAAPLYAQPQLLVPIAQDSVSDAGNAFYKDGMNAHFKYVGRFDYSEIPFIWFIWPDTSEHTSKDIATIRVWGYLDEGVELTIASGDDRSNLWVLQPLIQNPPTHGYGYYDYVFATQGGMQAALVAVSRQTKRQDGTWNGLGEAQVDCIEAIHAIARNVAIADAQSKRITTTAWVDVLGRTYRSLDHVPSGVYLRDGVKVVIVR